MFFNLEIVSTNLQSINKSVSYLKLNTIEYGEILILKNHQNCLYSLVANQTIEMQDEKHNNVKILLESDSPIIISFNNNKAILYTDNFKLI